MSVTEFNGVYGVYYAAQVDGGGGITILNGAVGGVVHGFYVRGRLSAAPDGMLTLELGMQAFEDGTLVTSQAVEKDDRFVHTVELRPDQLDGAPFTVRMNGRDVTVYVRRLIRLHA